MEEPGHTKDHVRARGMGGAKVLKNPSSLVRMDELGVICCA